MNTTEHFALKQPRAAYAEMCAPTETPYSVHFIVAKIESSSRRRQHLSWETPIEIVGKL